MHKYWIMGAAGCALLGVASLPASAAPASNIAGMMASTPEDSAGVTKAAYRSCWWHHGVRHCGWRRGEPYGYYYGRPRAEEFPTGSSAWWRAMDYEGRGGHGRTR